MTYYLGGSFYNHPVRLAQSIIRLKRFKMKEQDIKSRISSSTKRRKFSRTLKREKLRAKSQSFQRKCTAIKGKLKTAQISLKAEQSEHFIKNLSDRSLSDIEKIALGRGLKFITTPTKPTRVSILTALKGLIRTMRIRYTLHGKNARKLSKFRLKSSWFPAVTYSKNLEDYLEATKVELAKMPIRNASSNTSKAEKIALQSLKKDCSVVLKPFDKGRGIAVINRSDYVHEVNRQLNSVHYENLDQDITKETKQLVVAQLKSMWLNKEIDETTFKYLNPNNHKIRTPVIYVLPKVHKTPPINTKFIGRPIISGNGSPTEQISEFVDYFLLPIVKRQETYVKDTNHIISLLEATQLPENVLLATLDVVSMYTNTPQEESINVVCETYQNASQSLYEIPKISTASLRNLLKLILERNCFEFNGKFYLQKIGCAMGSQASPEICDIFMYKLEKSIIPTDPRIIRWFRYRDDILLLYKGNISELCSLVENMNKIHETIKFTMEASHESVTYLDLTIFKGKNFESHGRLDTKVYTKPTETYQYLDRTSAHPLSTFKGFIKGEILRYVRLSNNENDFVSKRNAFKEKLLARNYTGQEFDHATKGINFKERSNYLLPKPREINIPLVFKIKYTPHLRTKELKESLLRHWHLISENTNLCQIFPKPPFLAFERAPNLKDYLVNSRLKSDGELEENHEDEEECFLDALIEAL